MESGFEQVWNTAEELKTDLRTGAWILALKRISGAIEARGW
jgi:glutamate dehydrogenase/leucine dehydrogenase